MREVISDKLRTQIQDSTGLTDPELVRVFEVAYRDLRERAGSLLARERPNHTLQPTALVHEAFLKMSDQRRPIVSREQLIGIASLQMRRILRDYAKARGAAKRGAGRARAALDESQLKAKADAIDLETMLAVQQKLDDLESLNERHAKVVDLLWFGGLTIKQTAAFLGVSPSTIDNDWKLAKAWLRRELTRAGQV